MSFSPVLPLTGLGGWYYLGKTEARQSEAFRTSPETRRETEYFRENIATKTSAEALVSDRRILRVALGAFGLDEDFDKGFFIRRVLEDGTTNRDALANRLVDPRYAAFSEAFGFGSPYGARTHRAGFADEIIAAFETRQFEIAVGKRDDNLRLAMNFKRELADINHSTGTTDTRWYKLMGAPPLRTVLEGAFGLPDSFAALDLDRQLTTLKQKARAFLGSDDPVQFSDATSVEKIIERFLLRTSVDNVSPGSAPANVALTLLTSGGPAGRSSPVMESIFGALHGRT